MLQIYAKPHVLFVVAEDHYFWSHRLDLARAALRDGFRVTIATSAGKLRSAILAEGFEHIELSLSRGSMNPLREIGAVVELCRLMRHVNPDIVHLVAIKPILYGGVAARLARVPGIVCAVTGLGWTFLPGRWPKRILRRGVEQVYRWIARRRSAVSIIVQNQDDRRLFVDRGLASEEQIEVICGAGVDTQKFVRLPEPPGTPVVLTHCRMLWDKGVGEVVEAARLLKAQKVDAQFVLVGDPDPANPASIPRQSLQHWHHEGIVTWHARRNDIPQLLAAAHIACLPSYREGAPLSLIEAASCGRPIVTTDVPGCREVVRHRENGLLVPPRDAAALAKTLRYLIEHRDVRLTMGARGRQIAENELAADIVNSATLAIYARVLDKSDSTRVVDRQTKLIEDEAQRRAA